MERDGGEERLKGEWRRMIALNDTVLEGTGRLPKIAKSVSSSGTKNMDVCALKRV